MDGTSEPTAGAADAPAVTPRASRVRILGLVARLRRSTDGGAYGLEASAVTLLVMAVATGLLLRHAVQAGRITPRPYRKSVVK